tara:strand:- start:156 stop:515 length:360 start_codon:yes stop_codon:yes gene_type:complete
MNELDIQTTQGSPIAGLIGLAVIIVVLVGAWKVFTKAGRPGWAVLIPIYNAYVLCKIAGKPGWWVIMLIIPLISLIFAILLSLGLAEKFGKGAGFGIGLAFLSPIFIPILGFGSAKYQG